MIKFIYKKCLEIKLISLNEEYKVVNQCEKDPLERKTRLATLDAQCRSLEDKLNKFY